MVSMGSPVASAATCAAVVAWLVPQATSPMSTFTLPEVSMRMVTVA